MFYYSFSKILNKLFLILAFSIQSCYLADTSDNVTKGAKGNSKSKKKVRDIFPF